MFIFLFLHPGHPDAQPPSLQSEKQGGQGCPEETGAKTHSHVKESDQRDWLFQDRTTGLWEEPGSTGFGLRNTFLIHPTHFFHLNFHSALHSSTSWSIHAWMRCNKEQGSFTSRKVTVQVWSKAIILNSG